VGDDIGGDGAGRDSLLVDVWGGLKKKKNKNKLESEIWLRRP